MITLIPFQQECNASGLEALFFLHLDWLLSAGGKFASSDSVAVFVDDFGCCSVWDGCFHMHPGVPLNIP